MVTEKKVKRIKPFDIKKDKWLYYNAYRNGKLYYTSTSLEMVEELCHDFVRLFLKR